MINLVESSPCFKKENSDLIVKRNKKGLLHGNDNTPAYQETFFVDNEKVGEFFMYCQNGIIHRNNKPAIHFQTKDKSFSIFVNNNQIIDSVDGAIILKEKNISKKRISINSDYNYQFETKDLVFSFQSMRIIQNEKIIDHFYKLAKHSDGHCIKNNLLGFFFDIDSFLEHKTHPFKPTSLKFRHNKVVEASWLNKEGRPHRKTKPAIINYDKNTTSYTFFENGKEKETIFQPYRFSTNNETLKPTDAFYFKNKEIQSFYKENELNPFKLCTSGRELIILNFKI